MPHNQDDIDACLPHNQDDIDACQDIACQEIDEEIALGYLSPSAHQKYCPIHGEIHIRSSHSRIGQVPREVWL